MTAIDQTIRRECFVHSFTGQPGPCPNCGAMMKQESATYMIATRQGGRMADSFVLGGDFG